MDHVIRDRLEPEPEGEHVRNMTDPEVGQHDNPEVDSVAGDAEVLSNGSQKTSMGSNVSQKTQFHDLTAGDEPPSPVAAAAHGAANFEGPRTAPSPNWCTLGSGDRSNQSFRRVCMSGTVPVDQRCALLVVLSLTTTFPGWERSCQGQYQCGYVLSAFTP